MDCNPLLRRQHGQNPVLCKEGVSLHGNTVASFPRQVARTRTLSQLNSQRHLRPAREIAALFRDVPGAIENTIDLSSRLTFELSDLGYEFPHYPVPDGETMDSFLRKRVEEGVQRRYTPKHDRDLMERAKKQVGRELALIAKLGFAGYFLIVWDIVLHRPPP
jgi:error-prone DNA polymerase